MLRTLQLITPFLTVAVAASQVIKVRLNIATYPGLESECIGRDVGLTNTSIVVQYKLFEVAAVLPFEWIFLTEARIGGERSLNGSISLPTTDVPLGLQFRLLQLEHGGEGCNCWEVTEFAATLRYPDSEATVPLAAFTNINRFKCFSRGLENSRRRVFCFGSGNEARGVVTRAVYFGGNGGASGTQCPENSGNTLISPKGPSMAVNCDLSIYPRM